MTAGNTKGIPPEAVQHPLFSELLLAGKSARQVAVFFTNISATSTTYWSPAAVLQEWVRTLTAQDAGRAWIGLIDRHATPNPITTNLGLC